MRRRFDKTSDSRADCAGEVKKRSRAIDAVAFGLPFICVVWGVLLLERPAEKSAAPFDAALEVLESSSTGASDSSSTVQDAADNENAVVSNSGDENNEVAIEEENLPTFEPAPTDSSLPEEAGNDAEQEGKSGVEEAERLLAQLEFQFENVKKSDETDVDSILAILATIRDATCDLVENAPEETSKRAKKTFDEIQTLWQNLDAERAFFNRLEELDVAALDSDATRAFFDSITREFPLNAPDNSGEELNEYERDFAKVANSLDALQRVEQWNDFVEERGKALERFYVSKSDADAALNFLRDHVATDGTPREIAAIAKRERELEYTVQNEVATRRKVLLRIEAELARKYWTYRGDENSFYYLPSPPRVGANEYIADVQGNLKNVDIPQSAPEVAADESPQKVFLRELFARANEIQDETRAVDVALWYRNWCEILTEIQRTDRLDPILQYALFRDVADILASSDYYFARRLEPLTRMLDAHKLADLSKIDIFQTEKEETRNLRALARMRLTFLPKDHLTVDKTTEQLDANVAQFAWRYRRVGWLDRNFAGEWRCRLADGAPNVAGELWILLVSGAQEDDSASETKARWVKVGAVDGQKATVNLIASETPRGAIVFCRTRTDRETTVAKRSNAERIFRR